MPSESADIIPQDTESRSAESFARLWAAIEGDYPELCGHLINYIGKHLGYGTRADLEYLTDDTIGETVRRVLGTPEKFDPERPPLPWLVAIAHRVFHERSRRKCERTRRIDLSPDGWQAIKDGQCEGAEALVMDRIELSEVLSKLGEADRKALELSYIQGVTGQALVEALGVRTEAAAKTRVYRALQKAKHIARPGGAEVRP